MERLFKEGINAEESGTMRDSGILSARRKVEQYDKASYERLRQFAELIGLTKSLSPIQEKNTDAKPSEDAQSTI